MSGFSNDLVDKEFLMALQLKVLCNLGLEGGFYERARGMTFLILLK